MSATESCSVAWGDRVLKWASDRGLLDHTTAGRQLSKLLEEVGELTSSVLEEDIDGIADAVGDVCVVLRIIAAKCGLGWEECLEAAWEQIKDRKGRMIGGIFVKD